MLEAIRDILAWVFRPLTQRHRGNLRLIAGCLLLSAIIWFFNSLNKPLETTFSVPIKIKYDRFFTPLVKIPKKVEVRISGIGWHILKFSLFYKPNTMHIWIKHPSMNTRIDTSVVRHYLDTHFEGLSVDKVFLEHIKLPFDHISHKQIRLVVNEYSISIAEGYIRDSTINITPERIIVSGPKSNLAQLADSLEVSIPFTNLDKNFDESIRLRYFFDDSSLTCAQETVKVKFRVKKKSVVHVE